MQMLGHFAFVHSEAGNPPSVISPYSKTIKGGKKYKQSTNSI